MKQTKVGKDATGSLSMWEVYKNIKTEIYMNFTIFQFVYLKYFII